MRYFFTFSDPFLKIDNSSSYIYNLTADFFFDLRITSVIGGESPPLGDSPAPYRLEDVPDIIRIRHFEEICPCFVNGYEFLVRYIRTST